MSRSIRRAGLLALLACLAIAACARDQSDNDRDQHSGFYGGVTGGMARP